MPSRSVADKPPRVCRPRAVRVACLPLLLAGLLALSGCGPKPNTFAPYCPAALHLPNAEQLMLFRAGDGQDITDLVLQGQVFDVSGTCVNGDKDNTVDVKATVSFRFSRGPAMQGRQIDIPYLVTLAIGNDIREQATFGIRVDFPPNIDTVTASAEPIHMVFPVNGKTSAASYTIFATFVLTPAQLDYNRLSGRR